MKQTHYSVQIWVDFVRGLTPPRTDRSLLQTHLDACQTCRNLVEDLLTVSATVLHDRDAQVPPQLTESAKALFDLTPPARDWIRPLRQLLSKLMFDSAAMAPQPVGVRSRRQAGSATPRLMTFAAGKYDVDLHLDFGTSNRDGAEIVGQIARRSAEHPGVAGAVVQWIAGGETLAETETNRFGEFMLGHRATRSGVLRIAIREDRCRFDLPLEPKALKRN